MGFFCIPVLQPAPPRRLLPGFTADQDPCIQASVLSVAMIVVHHLNNSRSRHVLWLLEEIGLPYEVKHYERDPATLLAPAALRAVHPLGESPVIADGKLTLAESGAILEYLADHYSAGRLVPAHATPERLRCTYWLHYAEGLAMPPLLLKLVFQAVAERRCKPDR